MSSARVACLLGVMLVAAGGLDGQTTTAPASKIPAGGQANPTQLLAREIPNVALIKMPLGRVLQYYAELSGLNVEADWDALKSAQITKDTPVTLRAGRLTFAKLLDLTLNSIAPDNRPLSWELAGNTVTVSTQMQILLRKRLATALPERTVRGPEPAPALPREINFSETPLRLALDFIQEVTGVNFSVNWRSLETVGISKDTPITVRAKGVTIAKVLDMVLNQLNGGRDLRSSVYWVIDEGVVEIATGDALDRTTSVRVFNVADLLVVVPNFRAPQINLGSAGNQVSGNNAGVVTGGLFQNTGDTSNQTTGGGGDEEESRADLRQRARDKLISIIKTSIGEDWWAPTGKGSIQLLGDRLIISQTPLGFKLLERALSR